MLSPLGAFPSLLLVGAVGSRRAVSVAAGVISVVISVAVVLRDNGSRRRGRRQGRRGYGFLDHVTAHALEGALALLDSRGVEGRARRHLLALALGVAYSSARHALLLLLVRVAQLQGYYLLAKRLHLEQIYILVFIHEINWIFQSQSSFTLNNSTYIFKHNRKIL